ncbi:small basic family protein [uncultured Clostridium sp.]|jgi:small basic protein|uniref:small basic family protein n=1 Tax=uncultured Clostridium sp. TaxID=59620 RepID=UPI00260A9E86|nr:small basic family protein [uncultured Clostridium sp.]
MVVFTGLLIGIILGMISPGHIPDKFSPYVSIAILAALDSVFGAVRAMFSKNFKTDIFISGFLGNAVLAAILVYIGEKLGIPLHFAAVIVFGRRIFENFAIIRRVLLDKARKRE